LHSYPQQHLCVASHVSGFVQEVHAEFFPEHPQPVGQSQAVVFVQSNSSHGLHALSTQPYPGQHMLVELHFWGLLHVGTHFPPQHVNFPPPVLHSHPSPTSVKLIGVVALVEILLSQSLHPSLHVLSGIMLAPSLQIPAKQTLLEFVVLQSDVLSLLQSEYPAKHVVQV